MRRYVLSGKYQNTLPLAVYGMLLKWHKNFVTTFIEPKFWYLKIVRTVTNQSYSVNGKKYCFVSAASDYSLVLLEMSLWSIYTHWPRLDVLSRRRMWSYLQYIYIYTYMTRRRAVNKNYEIISPFLSGRAYLRTHTRAAA